MWNIPTLQKTNSIYNNLPLQEPPTIYHLKSFSGEILLDNPQIYSLSTGNWTVSIQTSSVKLCLVL